jgi:hypothetical protein
MESFPSHKSSVTLVGVGGGSGRQRCRPEWSSLLSGFGWRRVWFGAAALQAPGWCSFLWARGPVGVMRPALCWFFDWRPVRRLFGGSFPVGLVAEAVETFGSCVCSRVVRHCWALGASLLDDVVFLRGFFALDFFGSPVHSVRAGVFVCTGLWCLVVSCMPLCMDIGVALIWSQLVAGFVNEFILYINLS